MTSGSTHTLNRTAFQATVLTGLLFWGSLALLVAFVVTLPVNRWLIGRGLGHAAVHAHGHHY